MRSEILGNERRPKEDMESKGQISSSGCTIEKGYDP